MFAGPSFLFFLGCAFLSPEADSIVPAPPEEIEREQSISSSENDRIPTDGKADPQPSPLEENESAGAQTPPDPLASTPAASSPEAASPPADSLPSEKAPVDLSQALAPSEGTPEERPELHSDRGHSKVDSYEAQRNYYRALYRPSSNPARFYFASRLAVAMADSSGDQPGSRMGHLSLEAGQSWNTVGYGIKATVIGGELPHENARERSGAVLLGLGPSIGMGRLALVRNGFLDLRLGYNFFYVPQRGDIEALAPHGPSLTVDSGLLVGTKQQSRFRHGVGITLGWQGLVHSLTSTMPFSHMMRFGLSYFFG